MPGPTPSSPGRGDAIEVVIAGGGVAALEAALALRELAGDGVRLTLLTPSEEFVYGPAAVLEPYERRAPRRLALDKFAAEVDASLEHDTLASVDAGAGLVHTGAGRGLAFDALLVAVGATVTDPLPGAVAVHPAHPDERLAGVIEEIDRGSVQSVAFVASKPSWPLPVYELALLARERAEEAGVALRVAVLTAEDRPLELFGEEVSSAVAGLLADAEIELITGATVQQSAGKLRVSPGGSELGFDRVVAIPQLQGPRIEGLPADAHGFLPITARCEVSGVEGVYAAGDATTFPVKFGGIAAQQADAAAEAIAALAGASPPGPAPFDGVVHGVLVSGRRARLYFTARIEDGRAHDSRISEAPTWSPGAKIAARHLGPYLDGLWAWTPRWVAGQLAWERTLARLKSDAAVDA